MSVIPGIRQFVSLVSRGGMPIMIADAFGNPYPTTGTGALVFNQNPVFDNPIFNDLTVQGDITYTGRLIGAYHTPLLTEGDIYYHNALGPARLPLGAAGSVLRSNGTTVVWAAGSAVFPCREITADPTVAMSLTDGEIVVRTSAPCAVTLPPAAPLGQLARVSGDGNTSDVNFITVEAAAAGMINGATGQLTMQFAWETTLFRSLGGNTWSIL